MPLVKDSTCFFRAFSYLVPPCARLGYGTVEFEGTDAVILYCSTSLHFPDPLSLISLARRARAHTNDSRARLVKAVTGSRLARNCPRCGARTSDTRRPRRNAGATGAARSR